MTKLLMTVETADQPSLGAPSLLASGFFLYLHFVFTVLPTFNLR